MVPQMWTYLTWILTSLSKVVSLRWEPNNFLSPQTWMTKQEPNLRKKNQMVSRSNKHLKIKVKSNGNGNIPFWFLSHFPKCKDFNARIFILLVLNGWVLRLAGGLLWSFCARIFLMEAHLPNDLSYSNFPDPGLWRRWNRGELRRGI